MSEWSYISDGYMLKDKTLLLSFHISKQSNIAVWNIKCKPDVQSTCENYIKAFLDKPHSKYMLVLFKEVLNKSILQ